jgi:hypothetical protein
VLPWSTSAPPPAAAPRTGWHTPERTGAWAGDDTTSDGIIVSDTSTEAEIPRKKPWNVELLLSYGSTWSLFLGSCRAEHGLKLVCLGAITTPRAVLRTPRGATWGKMQRTEGEATTIAPGAAAASQCVVGVCYFPASRPAWVPSRHHGRVWHRCVRFSLLCMP